MSIIFDVAQYRQKSLHLFRNLLRACTYLPDSLARREISRQVVHRFRNFKARGNSLLQNVSSSTDPQTLSTTEATLQKRLITGYRALKTLRYAGDGGLSSLALVLRHAYGRTGKRRHELLKPLLLSDSPEHAESKVSTQLEKNVATRKWDISTVQIPHIFEAPKSVSGDYAEYHISSRYGQLKAVILAQEASADRLPYRRIRKAIFKMPTKNTWDRPMPRKRVKNILHKRYAYLLERVLPPLPEAEWTRLTKLALGELREELPERRKKVVLEKPEYLGTRDLEEVLHVSYNQFLSSGGSQLPGKKNAGLGVFSDISLSQNLRHFNPEGSWMEDPKLLEASKEQFLDEELLTRSKFAVKRNFKNDPHRVTTRFMRRQWQAILKECPKLEKQYETGTWQATFGTEEKTPQREKANLVPLFKLLAQPSLKMTAKAP